MDFGNGQDFADAQTGGITDFFAAQPMPETDEPMPAPAQPVALDRDRPVATTTAPGVAPGPMAQPGIVAPTPPSRTAAGLGLIAALGAGAAGFALGGWWGLAAGVLVWGGSRNALRAGRGWRSDPIEARRSAGAAVFGLGAGGFCAYKAYEQRRG